MTVADLAIIAGLVFAWGTLSARLERFDMTAPIVFTVAGVLLTHGLLAPLGITPGSEVVKVLTEATLALVLFSDAARVGLHQLRADLGLCLRLLGIGLPLAIGLAGDILPGLPDDLKTRLLDAFDIQVLWNKPGQQATVFAEITDATLKALPDILNPGQDGYDDTSEQDSGDLYVMEDLFEAPIVP